MHPGSLNEIKYIEFMLHSKYSIHFNSPAFKYHCFYHWIRDWTTGFLFCCCFVLHRLYTVWDFLSFFFFFLAISEVCGSSWAKDRTCATAATPVIAVIPPDSYLLSHMGTPGVSILMFPKRQLFPQLY